MIRIAFYDTKPYDRVWFDKLKQAYGFEFKYYENKLNRDTAVLASGCDAVVAFVNDAIDAGTVAALYDNGIRVVAMRAAGYNNIDFKAAWGKIHILRVPAYSPYAVAEHAMALLLTLNRKIHHAYNRTREFNFSINGLTGFDLHGKTAGVIGTGKIGQVFIDICKGFGMRVVAYDPFPNPNVDVEYVTLKQLCRYSDVISLHCPLTKDTYHVIDEQTIAQMKRGVILINTSRGALIKSDALLEGIKSGKLGGAGLDVYEEESDLFFEDFSNTIMQDDILARLITMPNVIVTSHQAFLTDEALKNIAHTTLENLKAYFDDEPLYNEICYQCSKQKTCDKSHQKRCF
ncbi:2-hydroxyacid dehydrogenase [Christensenella timonensis]|uniref:2-hydroxyacid dehydrogenase n=1 Tax=Christensenella timonensis TaxID=1816678 RepID=UPI000833C0A0|nr:2-hydroxyacid dehydrogenase [Christensenella timonensis]